MRISCVMARSFMRVACPWMAARPMSPPNGVRFLNRPPRPMLLPHHRARVKSRMWVSTDLLMMRNVGTVLIVNGLTPWVAWSPTTAFVRHGVMTLRAMTTTTSVAATTMPNKKAFSIVISWLITLRATHPIPMNRQSRMIRVTRVLPM